MSGNSFGEAFKVTTFGESHGKAVGVVVDGCPPGLELSIEDIQKELDRRRPGQSEVTTTRKEEDRVEILSGLFRGKTTGAPISMMVHNLDVDSSAYIEISHKPRPNHADLSYALKYGHYDWRGGGRASGRETVGRVAAGGVARKLLLKLGVEVFGHVIEIHGVKARDVNVEEIRLNVEKNPVRCADLGVAELMAKEVQKAKGRGDSVGGVVEVVAVNVPPGLGEPVFDKLDADLAKGLMSIGSVKGVEIGAGFGVSKKFGSENNDPLALKNGKIITLTNNSGGILGGISSGMPIVVRAAVKPTSSIALEQQTVDLEKMEETTLKVKGRHDPCIAPRVLPVCEAMVAIVLADHALRADLITLSSFKGK
jgi:chorismate synthase